MPQRQFDKEKLEALQAQGQFDYYDIDHTPSWWERITSTIDGWLKQFVDLLAEQLNWHIPSIIFEILFYGIIVGGILFLILKLLGVEVRSILPFTGKKIPIHQYEVSDENIDEMDFEKLIQEASANNNYMLMVRYRYLHLLKILSDQKLIQYELRKTNSEYVTELSQHATIDHFRNMVVIFERIWYGRIEADQSTFASMELGFEEIKKALR